MRRILLDEWDPIGRVPEDEYDSYISGVLRMLVGDCDAHRLASHLLRLESESLGLSGADPERCRRVAQRLLDLRAESPSKTEPVVGEIVATHPQMLVRLATGEEVVAGRKLPRRVGCIFGGLIGWKVKVVLRRPPRAARIVELVARPGRM